MDIGDMRRDFESEGLDREHLNDDPVLQFQAWFEDARTAGILEPNAMSLATAGTDQMPDLRTVLLKYFDNRGFVFYTNYCSRKALELEQNPKAALLFPWIGLNRQVRVQGPVEKVSKSESKSPSPKVNSASNWSSICRPSEFNNNIAGSAAGPDVGSAAGPDVGSGVSVT